MFWLEHLLEPRLLMVSSIIHRRLINLPTLISDSILCKAESILVRIENSESGVKYELIDSLGVSYGFVNSGGGITGINTNPIYRTGNYRIKATRISPAISRTFTNLIFIRVEQTKSIFHTNKINVVPGEPVNFFQQSIDAVSYNWTFFQDPNISSSTEPDPRGIFYASSGQETISLTTESPNGCKDTAVSSPIFVYTKPSSNSFCYAASLDSAGEYGHGLGVLTPCRDDGYIIAGVNPFGDGVLKSRYGYSRSLKKGSFYVAKFSNDATIKWLHHFKNDAGGITGSIEDKNGNIYILGTTWSLAPLYLNNGDSIFFQVVPGESRTNGFILKLDSLGNYLWHSILSDPTIPNTGYPTTGGYPTKIAIVDNHVVLIGLFRSKLNYFRNGVMSPMFDFQNFNNLDTRGFILKVDEDGNFLWRAFLGKSAAVLDIGLDKDGNSYIIGDFDNYIEIFNSNNALALTVYGYFWYQGLLVKYDPLGNPLWTNRFDGGTTRLKEIMIDEHGNSYITGSGEGGGIINTYRDDNSYTTDSLSGYFLYKIDPAGIKRWAVGTRSSFPLYPFTALANSVFVQSGKVYTVGQAYHRIDPTRPTRFLSTNGNHQTVSVTEDEFFVAAYDSLGALIKVTTSGVNPGGHLNPLKIIIDSKGNFIIGGNTDFGNGGTHSRIVFGMTINVPEATHLDGFIVKTTPDFCTSLDLCLSDGTAFFKTDLTGGTYQWQKNIGNGFENFTPDDYYSYSGIFSKTLQINTLTAAYHDYQYRCHSRRFVWKYLHR